MLKLRDFQEVGREFLVTHPQALLADDMGLGKTIQVIAACNDIMAERVLVVCPAAARINWQREFETWGMFFKKPSVLSKLSDKTVMRMICSYDYVARNYEKMEGDWDVVIFDESHFIKTPKTRRARGCYGRIGLVRKAKYVWCLSGTPAPNNASELWTMLYTFGVTRLNYNDFIDRYCNTIEHTYGKQIIGNNKNFIPELKEMLNKVMLRRKKEDVLKELPPISFENLAVEPGAVDIEMQASFLQYIYPKDEMDELATKLIREQRIVEGYIKENRMGFTGLKGLAGISDSVSTLRRYTGLQKVQPTIDIVSQELDDGAYEKIVIFAIHRDVIVGIQDAFKAKGYQPVTLYGRTNPKTRQRNIDKFQNNPKCRVFIGNIVAAGTAITLTAAHQVLFVEQDWTPGNNAQAAMRCHRMGQENKVFVRVMGVVDSFDERIARIIKRKTEDLTEIFDN